MGVRIQILPSVVGELGAIGQFLTSYLIDDVLAIDAGSLGFFRSPADQQRVRDVLLTHAHMDHIASLPTFLENVYVEGAPAVTVRAIEPVLEALREDILNDRIWPDFVRLSTSECSFVHLEPIVAGKRFDLAGLRVTAVAMSHGVPAVGYLLEGAGASVVVASDTGPTQRLWKAARRLPDLKAVFLECSFPNRSRELARLSHHLTPNDFAGEIAKLGRPRVRFIAVHLKPRFREEIIAELDDLGIEEIEIGRFDEPYRF